MMTDEQIYKKIETIYESDKGKGFITHLLRSFFPMGKGEFMWETPKGGAKCCITGITLIGKGDALGAVMAVTPEEMGEFIRSGLRITEEGEEQKPIEHPMKKHLPKNSLLGVESPESTAKMCQPAYQQLYNFYVNRLLHDDKHIGWVAKSMQTKQMISMAREKGIDVTEREEKAVMKKVNKPAATTFGDLAVLQQLKEKLEREES